jgi:hypothetical protein
MAAYFNNYIADPVSMGVRSGYQAVAQGAQSGYQRASNSVHANCVYMGNKASEAVRQTTDKVADFFYKQSGTLLYIGCTVATATFSPQLFIPTVIASLIVRIEATRYMRDMAKEYLKPEKNFMETGAARPTITTLDMAMATIAAVDAVALGTIFYSHSITINLLPALGGIAAGSSFAKAVMNWAEKPVQQAVPQEETQDEPGLNANPLPYNPEVMPKAVPELPLNFAVPASEVAAVA